ncbi:TB2/DP1, HVA22 family domain-containing protein [Ceratobasidium sp. AG-Ba]|nr:TB2/DP1, HVA22 family domain-containing protein [Ceratobasidium sp. AG-Ba]
MVFYHLARLCSVVYVFLYPAYGVYKALQRRPPSLEEQQAQEAERKRWLEYWAVMAFVLSTEYAAEFPGYWLFKSIFLLWLVAPQTQGASFVFHTFLAPYLAQHEGEIDSYLLRLNTSILAIIQEKLGQLLAIVLPSMQLDQQQQQQQQQNPQAAQPPANYAAGAMLGLLQQYGPSLMSSGANLFRGQGGPQTGAARSHPPTPGASATASGYELRPEMAHQVSQSSFNSRTSNGAPSFPVPEVPQ